MKTSWKAIYKIYIPLEMVARTVNDNATAATKFISKENQVFQNSAFISLKFDSTQAKVMFHLYWTTFQSSKFDQSLFLRPIFIVE